MKVSKDSIATISINEIQKVLKEDTNTNTMHGYPKATSQKITSQVFQTPHKYAEETIL